MADAKAMSTFDVKLKQLVMTCKRTDSVLDSNKDTAIKRQLEALKALTNETELEKADDDVKRLEKWQDDCKLEKERNAFEEKLKYEVKLHETTLKLESEHQAKLESGSSSKEIYAKQVEAKLPKLVISKFDGNYMDWQRFWDQFTESIEKSGLASRTRENVPHQSN
ncbi:Hypothetical predicted protein [Paramuricea clavata]|uniref:Uncharacterized protein n=1 Tax=Paramuricea clavata TaxID=317549 RepID=A0A6S7INA4_PARCT|nr:Hypothetical predicted protein [Paramuricea clavata]